MRRTQILSQPNCELGGQLWKRYLIWVTDSLTQLLHDDLNPGDLFDNIILLFFIIIIKSEITGIDLSWLGFEKTFRILDNYWVHSSDPFIFNIMNACATSGLIVIIILAVMFRFLPHGFRPYAQNHTFIIVKRVKAILDRLVSFICSSKLLVSHSFTPAKAVSVRWINVLLSMRRVRFDRWSLNKLLARYKRSLNASSNFFLFFGFFASPLNCADKYSLPLCVSLSVAPIILVIDALHVFWFICGCFLVLMKVDTGKAELWEGCLFELSKVSNLLDLGNLGFCSHVYVKKDDFNSLMTH